MNFVAKPGESSVSLESRDIFRKLSPQPGPPCGFFYLLCVCREGGPLISPFPKFTLGFLSSQVPWSNSRQWPLLLINILPTVSSQPLSITENKRKVPYHALHPTPHPSQKHASGLCMKTSSQFISRLAPSPASKLAEHSGALLSPASTCQVLIQSRNFQKSFRKGDFSKAETNLPLLIFQLEKGQMDEHGANLLMVSELVKLPFPQTGKLAEEALNSLVSSSQE